MSFEPRDYLRHILVEADYLTAQTAGLTREEFVADETRRRAFVRSIEISQGTRDGGLRNGSASGPWSANPPRMNPPHPTMIVHIVAGSGPRPSANN